MMMLQVRRYMVGSVVRKMGNAQGPRDARTVWWLCRDDGAREGITGYYPKDSLIFLVGPAVKSPGKVFHSNYCKRGREREEPIPQQCCQTQHKTAGSGGAPTTARSRVPLRALYLRHRQSGQLSRQCQYRL